MFGLPSPYAILAAAGLSLALMVGAYFYGTHHEAAIWKAAIAEQKAQAAQLLADRTKQVLDREHEAADLNSKLELTHAQAATDAADADAKLRDALRVRRIAPGGGCSANSMPAGASAGKPEDAAGERDSGLAGSVDSLIADTARAGNELAAYARECNAWVIAQ